MWKTLLVDDVDEISSVANAEYGSVVATHDTTSGFRLWKYCQLDNGTANLTPAANDVVYFVAASYDDACLVTSDVSDSDINAIAGVTPTAITDQYWGYVLVGGYYATVKTNGDDDIAAHDALIGSSTDAACNSVAQDTAPTNTVLGWALVADVDADNTVAARITVGAF